MEQWQHPETIGYWIMTSLAVVILLASFIVLLVKVTFKKIIDAKDKEIELQLEHHSALLETSLLVQEKERFRIAADIHDELVGKLLALQLLSGLPNAESQPNHILEECITTARRISHDLTPPMLEYASLTELIIDLLEPFRSVYECNFYSRINETQVINPTVKIQLMRIVQECLSNIRKHAEASVISIHLRCENENLYLKIEDNGVGYDHNEVLNGLGLRNIKARIHYLKGKYKFRTLRTGGTSHFFFITLNA